MSSEVQKLKAAWHIDAFTKQKKWMEYQWIGEEPEEPGVYLLVPEDVVAKLLDYHRGPDDANERTPEEDAFNDGVAWALALFQEGDDGD